MIFKLIIKNQKHIFNNYQLYSHLPRRMLPFHIINPEKKQQNDAEFVHYLSLGSHNTSIQLPSILSFSKIMLTPKKNLPKINIQSLKSQYQAQGLKVYNLVIPLYGELSIDNKTISNLFEAQTQISKEQSTFKKHFEIKQCKYLKNVEYISNKHEKDISSAFLYVLYRTKEPNQVSQKVISANQARFASQIQSKSITLLSLNIQSSCIEISLIQVLQDSKIELNSNDLVYLQKGKLILPFQNTQTEIKNKGNRKGQQNYIQNMIFISQSIKAQAQQGSLMFLISLKGQ